MIGCDLHLRSMLLQYCVGDKTPQQASFVNDAQGRKKMIDMLQAFAEKQGAERIVFVYEASSLGYGLCDELYDCGIECHVLSPTHLPKSAKQAKPKTDARDAMMRLLAIKMWHRALKCGVSSELVGRGGPHDLDLSRARAASNNTIQ